MREVDFESIFYQPSESIEIWGKRDKINPYLEKNFEVRESRNGYWVLVKSAKAIAYVKDNENGRMRSFDMRSKILEYYGRKKLLIKLVEQFDKDAKDGKIRLYLDENDNLVIQ